MSDMTDDEERCIQVVCVRIVELEKRINMMQEFNQQAIRVAHEALTIRLEHSNGLIEQMDRQAREFISRREAYILIGGTLAIIGTVLGIMVQWLR